MSIFNKDIYNLTQKKNLNYDDKLKIKNINSRFSLEHFHFYRHYFKKGYLFNDIDYRRLNYFELLNSCCNSIE